MEFLEWLEGLGAKDRGSCEVWDFFGIFGEFLRYLEWLGPNHKYFLETEVPATIFPTRRDRELIYNKLRGFFTNFARFNGIWNYFSMV
ncbi:hypothetical protein, partial [Arcobacter sp.]|uniref:hypothetical protein n=1 Tax=Arcobacter sp. TaxID=1872629 RepID=UPI003D0B2E2B